MDPVAVHGQEGGCLPGAMGMKASAVANCSMGKVGAAYEMTSNMISRMRSQHRKGEEVLDEFTDEERKKMI